jgi:hypothetical protein
VQQGTDRNISVIALQTAGHQIQPYINLMNVSSSISVHYFICKIIVNIMRGLHRKGKVKQEEITREQDRQRRD